MSIELIVAEKPKVAAKIAQAIGENIKHKKSGSVSYYEGTTDGKHIIVAPAVGHIYSLAQIEKNNTYPTFDIEWKPAYEVDKEAGYTKQYVDLLEALGKKADEFISACDYDIEGCLPSFEKVVIVENNVGKITDVGSYIDSRIKQMSLKYHNGFEFIDLPFDAYISAMDSDLKTVSAKIKKIMRRKAEGLILKITLEHGKIIHVTKNHPLFVFSKNGLVQKRASALNIDEFLPSAKKVSLDTTINEIDIIKEIIRYRLVSSFYVYGFSRYNKKMPAEVSQICKVKRTTALGWRFFDRIPLEYYLLLETDVNLRKHLKIGVKKAKTKIPAILPLNRDLGKLLGYYLAEGCIDSGGFIGFYFGPTEDDLVDEVASILSKLNLNKIKRRKRKIKGQLGNSVTPEIGTKSKILSFLFENVFSVGKNSHQKRLPPFLLSTTQEFKLGIIDGYLLGDGSAFITKASNRCILSAYSVSQQLIEQFHTLLLCMGVSSSIGIDKKRSMYFLNISIAQEIYKLLKMGGASVVTRKKLETRLIQLVETKRTRNDILSCLPNFLIDSELVTPQTRRNIHYGGPSARTAVTSLKSHSPFIKALLSSDIHPLKVLKIEEVPYEGYVYNFQTETSNFMHASGIVTHNSTIAWNVYRFTPANGKPARRMKFSAVTHTDLQEAYESMGEMDYNNAYAGEARHVLDWYFGINLSRALMSALKAADRWKVMSIGRVQGPSLELLTALEKQIAAFVPTPYWELNVFIKGIEFKHANGRFLDEKEAKKALDNTKPNGTVTRVEKKENLLYPYPPFDLTSLQVEAYRVFGYAPTRTLDIAQRLYEDSFITYPRTSSQQFPPTIKLAPIIKKLSEQAQYAAAAKYLLDNSMFKPMQGKKTDPAHPAIHPTGLAPEGVHEQEMKLYDLITKRFLALFAPAAKREKTNIEVNAGESYVADGMRIVEKGWTGIYSPYYKGEDIELPKFEESEKVAVENKKKHKKETKPPNRYTEASIISELEDRHLGTKATRATIVETLFKRHYIHGKSIKVTDFGIKVVEVLEKYAPEILDEQLTRKIEDDMEKIQDGSMTKEAVIQEGKEVLIQTLDKWKKNEEKIGKELLVALKESEEKQSTIGTCDKCKTGNLRIIRLKQGKQFIGCTSYPNCNNAYPLPGYAYITVMEKPCEHCSKPMINVKRTKMRPFNMCIDPKCPSKAGWGKKKEDKKEEKREKQ